MGTGWSQDEAVEASQSQLPKPAEVPGNKAVVEKATGECCLKTSDQTKPSAGHGHDTKLNEAKATENTAKMKEVKKAENTTVAHVRQQQLPHNYEAIMKDADLPISRSAENLYGHLYAGILLCQKRKKYWVDKKLNNCFMVYPRDLAITWGDDRRYWQWPAVEETSNVFIDVAELLNVCWLEVKGKFDTTKLSPGTLYEVVIVVMMKATGNGWEYPVNFRLTLPDGTKQESKINLVEKVGGQWTEIPIGEFRATPGKPGDIEFSMYEYDGGTWKRGLVIKGVAIRPKN